MPAIDPAILAQINELDRLRSERTDHWQIPRPEGEMLYHICLISRARLVIEVGTSYGFSGLFWGAALKQTGGALHTIDLDRKKYDSSRETFMRAGLSNTIINHQGDAKAILPTLPNEVDIAFVDANKDATRAYFDLIWPKLKRGGCVITDNATTHREELADFVAHVRSRDDASSVEVAVGNGVEWTIKVK